MLDKLISVPQASERNGWRRAWTPILNHQFSGSECQRLGSLSRHNSPIQSLLPAIFEG
jgi:hypothetical protein